VNTREINLTVEPPEPVSLVFATIRVIFWFEFKVIVSVVVKLLLGTLGWEFTLTAAISVPDFSTLIEVTKSVAVVR
jgi:hypothetical protein